MIVPMSRSIRSVRMRAAGETLQAIARLTIIR